MFPSSIRCSSPARPTLRLQHADRSLCKILRTGIQHSSCGNRLHIHSSQNNFSLQKNKRQPSSTSNGYRQSRYTVPRERSKGATHTVRRICPTHSRPRKWENTTLSGRDAKQAAHGLWRSSLEYTYRTYPGLSMHDVGAAPKPESRIHALVCPLSSTVRVEIRMQHKPQRCNDGPTTY